MELAQKSPQWFLRKGKDMVNKAIRDLALYGVRTGLITEADVPYVINRLIDEMKLDAYEEPQAKRKRIWKPFWLFCWKMPANGN